MRSGTVGQPFSYPLKAPTGAVRDEWIANARQDKQVALELELLTRVRRVSIGDWFMWVCLVEDFGVAMIENPGYVAQFYDIIPRCNREIIPLALKIKPDVIQYCGSYDTPDYRGRDRRQRVLAPRIERLARQVYEAGWLFCYLFTEGYTLYRDVPA